VRALTWTITEDSCGCLSPPKVNITNLAYVPIGRPVWAVKSITGRGDPRHATPGEPFDKLSVCLDPEITIWLLTLLARFSRS